MVDKQRYCKIVGKGFSSMDLRTEKTKNNIINAFIELRSRKPLEKITVKELSELALINKSTFYSHYKDIFDLSDSLETEITTSIVKNISHPEYIFTNSAEFVTELTYAFLSQRTLLETIFSGTQSNRLAYKIEESIKSLVFEQYPHLKDDVPKNVLLSYCIHGGYHAFMQYSHHDADMVIHAISQASEVTRGLYKVI